jgi:hypothetical protein
MATNELVTMFIMKELVRWPQEYVIVGIGWKDGCFASFALLNIVGRLLPWVEGGF